MVTDSVVIAALVAVRFPNVPTDVNDELTIFGLSVVPVKVLASMSNVISVVPLKNTPLIFLPVCNAVAVPALPVIVPLIALVTARLVAVKFVITPTEVNEELTTLGASVVPVNELALISKVISVVPSNATPLMLRAVVSLAALATVPLI